MNPFQSSVPVRSNPVSLLTLPPHPPLDRQLVPWHLIESAEMKGTWFLVRFVVLFSVCQCPLLVHLLTTSLYPLLNRYLVLRKLLTCLLVPSSAFYFGDFTLLLMSLFASMTTKVSTVWWRRKTPGCPSTSSYTTPLLFMMRMLMMRLVMTMMMMRKMVMMMARLSYFFLHHPFTPRCTIIYCPDSCHERKFVCVGIKDD